MKLKAQMKIIRLMLDIEAAIEETYIETITAIDEVAATDTI